MNPTVVYIMSTSRSGSTALALALGGFAGVFNGGEFRNLALSGLARSGMCGCHAPIRSCPFWTAVAERSQRLHEVWMDPEPEIAAQATTSRTRNFYRIILNHGKLRRSREHDLHLGFMKDLYQQTASVAGANVLIDASKSPVGAVELEGFHEFPSFLLHLTRDPRGVAHSMSNPKIQTGDPSQRMMTAMGPVRSAVSWDVINAQAEAVGRRCLPRYMHVRYEDLARQPDAVIAEIWRKMANVELLGEPPSRLTHMQPNHTAWGNPIRSENQQGVAWALDERWRSEMNSSAKRLTTVLTWPIRKHYGYPGLSGN